jgi:hypothetical protein
MSKIFRMTALCGCMSAMLANDSFGENIYCHALYGGHSQEIRQKCEGCVESLPKKEVYKGTGLELGLQERQALHKCITGTGL